MSRTFQLGVDTLLADHSDWVRGARVGLVAHAASVDAAGVPTADRLRAAGVQLAALFGPEHGFASRAGAGEPVAAARHPAWNIPIHSLYGATRKPTPAMLAGLDALLFDLQDLGVRCYTYCATLRNVLEAATEQHIAVIVLDRPVPLAGVVDGPLPDEGCMDFVAALPAPFCYGLTPGETALWLRDKLRLDLHLRVTPARGPPSAGHWIPPSPAIRSAACARAYPATVLFEAFPAFDVSRQTAMAFQEIRLQPAGHQFQAAPADWKRIAELALGHLVTVPGANAGEQSPSAGKQGGLRLEALPDGLRLTVTGLAEYRPALTGIALVHALQQVWGAPALWAEPGARPAWFDRLLGTDRVRLALQAGATPADIAEAWEPDLTAFRAERQQVPRYARPA